MVDIPQTNTAANASAIAPHCSGNSDNTGDTESNTVDKDGTLGSTERTVTVDGNAADLNAVWMEIVNIDDYDGASGNWTWRLNCSTGNMSIVLDEVHICHVDSGYSAKNTLGSSTGIATSTDGGALSGTINQSAGVTIAAGDKIIIIYAFDNSTGGGMTGDFGYTPDQNITAPGAFPAGVTEITLSSTDTGSATIARRGQFFRALEATVTGAVRIVRMFFRTLSVSGGGYEANAWTFDGTNDFISGSPVGSDGQFGMVSFWFRLNATGVQYYFWSNTNNFRILVRIDSSGNMFLRVGDGVASLLWQGNLSGLTVSDTDWHHFAASWDSQSFTTTDDMSIMFDGVSHSLDAAANAAGDGDFSGTYYIGANSAAGDKLDGDMAEVVVWDGTDISSYVDLTQSTNIEKLRTSSGFPENLGSDGSAPGWGTPVMYLKSVAASAGTNSGSGSNLSITGTLDVAATSPSDGAGGGAIATLSRVFMTNRSFSATATAAATLAFSLFFNRILSATATGAATLLKHFSTIDFSATVTGLATIAHRWLALRIFSATATASATIARRLRAFREFSVTITGIATLVIEELGGGVTAITLAASATALATLRKMEFRTLSAVDTALATIARRWLAFRTFNATVTGSATIARLGQFFRTFNAAATGLATLLKHFSTVAFSATVTSSARLLKMEFRDFSATVTGLATIVAEALAAGLTAITLAASATAQATLRKMEFRTLSVVATGAVTFLKNFSTVLFEAKVGSLAVKADFIRFDGVSTFVEWATGPSTATDGRAGTFAIPFNREGGTGEQCIFYIGTTTGESIYVGFNAANNLVARISDGAAQVILALISTTTYSDSVDRVAVFSFDLDTDDAWLKVNTTDVEKQTPTLDAGSEAVGGVSPLFTVTLSAKAEALPVLRSLTVNAADIDFTDTWRFGSTDDSGDRQWYSGSAGHVYGELGYHDPGNISLFYSTAADGPRDHGGNGARATSRIPPLYWVPAGLDPTINNGDGGNADSASVFSDAENPPLLGVTPATLSRRASYRKTFDAAATGSAVLLHLAQFFRIMAATVTGLATLLRRGQFFRTFSATAAGLATIVRMFFRTISAAVTGLATLIVDALGSGLTTITLAATATAQATLERLALFRRTLSATATGLATIVRMFFRTLSATVTGGAVILLSGLFSRIFSATVTGVATIERLFRALRTLSATVTSAATLARFASLRRTLEATATAQATIARLAEFRRVFNATVTGSAALIRGAAFQIFTVTLSAASTAVATIVSLYQQFVQPFTGHGGLGMRDGPGRWKHRVSTWRRRK